MKSFYYTASAMFYAFGAAHPRVQGGLMKESATVTAFIIDDKGNPSVECWDISSVVTSNGPQGSSNKVSIAKGGDLEFVDVLTWPSASFIFPNDDDDSWSGDYSNSRWGNVFGLFNVQDGLVNVVSWIGRNIATNNDFDDEVERHTFSSENGDDWFYFEDNSDGMLMNDKAAAPFQISTVSATETEIFHLSYTAQPKHTVLHKGACKFTGVHASEAAPGSKDYTHERSPVTVQVHIDDL